MKLVNDIVAVACTFILGAFFVALISAAVITATLFVAAYAGYWALCELKAFFVEGWK